MVLYMLSYILVQNKCLLKFLSLYTFTIIHQNIIYRTRETMMIFNNINTHILKSGLSLFVTLCLRLYSKLYWLSYLVTLNAYLSMFSVGCHGDSLVNFYFWSRIKYLNHAIH